jgi:acetate kinase
MGLTPLDGLVMATRSGAVDPGLVLWLVEHGGMSAHEVAEGIDRRGGLLGLAGTKDMREVLARSASGDDDAVLAVEVYLHRLAASVAAMTAALGGLDALVVTGGVGEASADVRRLLVERLGFLGLELDPGANDGFDPGAGIDADVSADGAAARVLVVPAREDAEIARGTRSALG